MQKLLVVVLSVTASSFFTDRGSAATKILNHSANEIEEYCRRIGGTFRWDTEKYYCVKPGNSGIIMCYWGTNECYSGRQGASAAGKTAGPNTRDFGSAPPKPPAKANVTGGAIAGAGRVTTTPGTTLSSGVTAAPAKPAPANSATSGGGAFGGMLPTMPGPAGVAGRKLR